MAVRSLTLQIALLVSLWVVPVAIFACSPSDGCAGCGPGAGDACNKKLDSIGDTSEPFVIQTHPIRLFQPPDDATWELDPEPGIGIFFTYFNLAWPWILGIAAGIAVLQAVRGGIMIMLSGSKTASEAGKTILMWALAGLLMIGLSGMILETLNPLFFVQP